jgi:hypothetical protein
MSVTRTQEPSNNEQAKECCALCLQVRGRGLHVEVDGRRVLQQIFGAVSAQANWEGLQKWKICWAHLLVHID